ncbi:hypothetical protein ADUPG1_003158, partial [Aduncisulcus paluster]
GKRRNAPEIEASEKERKPQRTDRSAPFIKHRDPRYHRFFPKVICTKCKKRGHYATDCKEEGTGSKDQSSYRVCSLLDGSGNSLRPITITRARGEESVEVVALFDTGAVVSVLNQNLAEELELEINQEEKSFIESISGEKLPTL